MKRCPFCQSIISDDTYECMFCGRNLKEAEVQSPTGEKTEFKPAGEGGKSESSLEHKPKILNNGPSNGDRQKNAAAEPSDRTAASTPETKKSFKLFGEKGRYAKSLKATIIGSLILLFAVIMSIQLFDSLHVLIVIHKVVNPLILDSNEVNADNEGKLVLLQSQIEWEALEDDFLPADIKTPWMQVDLKQKELDSEGDTSWSSVHNRELRDEDGLILTSDVQMSDVKAGEFEIDSGLVDYLVNESKPSIKKKLGKGKEYAQMTDTTTGITDKYSYKIYYADMSEVGVCTFMGYQQGDRITISSEDAAETSRAFAAVGKQNPSGMQSGLIKYCWKDFLIRMLYFIIAAVLGIRVFLVGRGRVKPLI